MMPNFTKEDHQKRMREILSPKKPTNVRGLLEKILRKAREARAGKGIPK